MIKVKVCLYGDADLLYKCYKPEIQRKDRSSFSLRKNKDNVEFNIKAKDDTALKATINSIFKLFIVYNKLRRTKKKKKMVEISKDAQEKISQLQLLEQNLQNLLLQRQQFQAQLTEIESALKELKDAKKSYKIIGNIMVDSSKEDLEKDLAKKKEVIELRIKSLEKQEGSIKEKQKQIQKEVLSKIKKE